MSSRQEEKQRRREERLAQEQAEARAAGRRRKLQLAAGVVLGLAAVAAIAVAIVAAGGGDGGGGNGAEPDAGVSSNVKLPERRIENLAAAAKAAGCVLQNAEAGPNDRNHTTEDVNNYRHNPPIFGPHDPTPAQDGVYDPGNSPRKEALVHTLEHGRVIIQYKPGLPGSDREKLEALFNEQVGEFGPGYHLVLVENNTNMPYEVAVTAWGHLLGCKDFNEKSYDAIRAFREQYTDKGPELVP
jgi:hypothetical protein